MTELPTHSPLGASGAHRWMACPASVGLSEGIEDNESDHAALGTAAHLLAATALKTDSDAWQYVGRVVFNDQLWTAGSFDGTEEGPKFEIDKAMADAVQEYLTAVRLAHPDRNQGNLWIERRFHCPSIHKLCFGTTDCTYLHEEARTLHVWDYKHGVGVVVEVERNPQLLYYAAGMMEDLDLWETVDEIVLHVAQPRGFHFDGPIRKWALKTHELVAWLEDVLVPAMDRALVSHDTASGEHCRFCPARSHGCPQLLKDMDELEAMVADIQKRGAPALTNEQVARFLNLLDIAKIVGKAANETAFARLSSGHAIPGYKLAKARANRIWREGAEAELKAKFGDAAYETKLKSPAQIENLPEGEAFVARFGFKPDAGLTVAKGDDARPAVSKDTKSLFTPQPVKQKKGRA